MPLISDTSQTKKLKKYNINIKTKYIVGDKILERNTNNSYNDDIKKGIRCKKEYFVEDRLLHTEKTFDSRIEYTFISKAQENSEHTCPNCGMHGKLKEFIDGCPYCRTYYNIDYTDKDMGGKYHYDRILRNTTYRIITAIIDILVSLILSYVFIKNTSRTFNSYDISKIFIYGTILALILYYFFYIIDAYIVLGPIKTYKDAQNKKQIDFWNRTNIDKKTFFNNLNYEIKNKYYDSSDIIDYDIIDFDKFEEFTKDNDLYVKVDAYVRIVMYKDKKFTSKFINDSYLLKRINGEVLELKNGANMIKCHKCGASIDATKGYCEYCHIKIKYLQEWILENRLI